MMLITAEKIKVTDTMMKQKGMLKGINYGIPVDPNDPNKGLSWKPLMELSEEDFDKIEEYFLNKRKEADDKL